MNAPGFNLFNNLQDSGGTQETAVEANGTITGQELDIEVDPPRDGQVLAKTWLPLLEEALWGTPFYLGSGGSDAEVSVFKAKWEALQRERASCNRALRFPRSR